MHKMKIYSLFTRNVHTFQINVQEPGSHGSQLFSCLLGKGGFDCRTEERNIHVFTSVVFIPYHSLHSMWLALVCRLVDGDLKPGFILLSGFEQCLDGNSNTSNMGRPLVCYQINYPVFKLIGN